MSYSEALYSRHTGTGTYYSLAPLTEVKLTDGTKELNDLTPIVQDTAILFPFLEDETETKVKYDPQILYCVNLKSKDGKGYLEIEDMEGEIIYQKIYNSLPKEIQSGDCVTMYCTNDVLYLSSEH